MSETVLFAFEAALNGLTVGIMYSLVALGFVLIFKASGIFNFAQGVMALFAALTLVGFQEGAVPFAPLINATFGTSVHNFGFNMPTLLAIPAAVAVMVGFAWLVERIVLKHLINQEPIILFMATIGLAYFLEGLGDIMWGAEVKRLDVGIPQGGNVWFEENTQWLGMGNENFWGFYIDTLNLYALVIAAILVTALVIFSQYTKQGRALRAVADDHQAALSVGISLRFIWVLTWSIAGIVALVAGIMWGSKSGVQFSLSLIALKALPVLILGGFTSIPGAIVGGLMIGIGEKLFDFFMQPIIGGATENWFAYMLALAFLLFRPQGLFGEKIIERV